MRSALATAGQMIAAVAAAVLVSTIALIAISRVQWPAFPSSNQLHALTTVGQVGCLVLLLGTGFVWRKGYEWVARIAAAVFLSAFTVVTLGMPLGRAGSTSSVSQSISSSAPNTSPGSPRARRCTI